MFPNKFADFKNPLVLRNVIFNMTATSKIIVGIVTGLKTSVIIDCESPTKIFLGIGKSSYIKMNLKVQ